MYSDLHYVHISTEGKEGHWGWALLLARKDKLLPPQLSDMDPLSSLSDSRGKSHLQSQEVTDWTGPCSSPIGHQRSAPSWSLLVGLRGAGVTVSRSFWPPRASRKSQKKSHSPPQTLPMQCSP